MPCTVLSLRWTGRAQGVRPEGLLLRLGMAGVRRPALYIQRSWLDSPAIPPSPVSTLATWMGAAPPSASG